MITPLKKNRLLILVLVFLGCSGSKRVFYYNIPSISDESPGTPYALSGKVILSQNGLNEISLWDICIYPKYYLFRSDGDGYKKIKEFDFSSRKGRCKKLKSLHLDTATIYTRYKISNLEDLENEKAAKIPISYVTADSTVLKLLSDKQ